MWRRSATTDTNHYTCIVYTMWCSMWTRRRCVRFTEFFFRFYRIRGILMSAATAGRGGPYAAQRARDRPAATHIIIVVIRFYLIICIQFTQTHTHTHTRSTSNNSIVLYYNDGLKYVFVIFFFHFFFHRSVRPSVYIRDENLDRNTNTLRAI